jgi:hypothetical protein
VEKKLVSRGLLAYDPKDLPLIAYHASSYQFLFRALFSAFPVPSGIRPLDDEVGGLEQREYRGLWIYSSCSSVQGTSEWACWWRFEKQEKVHSSEERGLLGNVCGSTLVVFGVRRLIVRIESPVGLRVIQPLGAMIFAWLCS